MLAAALLLPVAAHAVSIGDIALQSRLGEPLRARVDLTLDKGERIDSACLSLILPDPREEDPAGYLTKADLTYKADDALQYVLINTHEPFNEAFAKLRLQIKCPGTGNIVKTLIALPDPDASATQSPIAAPVVKAEAEAASAVPPAAPDAASAAKAQEALSAPAKAKPVEVKKSSPERAAQPARKPRATRAAKRHGKTTHTASPTKRDAKSGLKAVIKIQPFGAPADESHRKAIADDQMASLLDMQHQVKELQAELAAMKLKLAQSGLDSPLSAPQPSLALTSSTVPVVSAVSAASAASAPENIQKPAAKPPVAVKQPVAQDNLPGGLFAALGLILAILALWLGLRYYARLKTGAQSTEKASSAEFSPAIKPASPHGGEKLQAGAVPHKATAEERSPHVEEKSEEDLALEEAALYASHKREAKSIEILREIIKHNPAKVEAWSLLLSIYSGQGNAGEFEQAARAFLSQHKNHPLWSQIQSWGRVLDQNNPLYRQ